MTFSPPTDQYGMKYLITGEGPSVTYIGLPVYERDGKARTALFDREWEYPFHIRRYTPKESVVSTAQWKGVLIGRTGALLNAL